ncbi:uncharacterized protein F4807DRAFT_456873 [Annulohypoxylon truncatum]|uniref:uncharacterized protein n=1 Tax=Annulohypoxylon truncatum TaxID=327061 RepID=UPI002008184E|nr:uncharacterized protein F4807DRAFT_456873 [Annulohypoxylon truncatum]KAI1213527.1 hypothetical protein F4807DRAFT_456873 [Annulohypoxylon truncatum]
MTEPIDPKYPRVIARGNFQKETENQLSVRMGETLYIIWRGYEQWLFVMNANREQGFVDRNWVMEMLL